MKKLIRSKWLVIILICVAMVVFNALIFNVSIINRSVVIGIGIDYENEEYTLTTQIILPKNGGVSSGGNNYVCYTAKAKGIDVAVDKIEKEHGTELSFAQATMLMLGAEMIKHGDLKLIEHFFVNDKVHDNLQLAMVDGKAIEIMQSNVPAGEVACLQIVKQLRPPKALLGVSAISLQEFIREIKSGNKVTYLPIIKKTQTPPSVDQGKDKVEKADKFEVNTTAIITPDGLKGVLDEKMTLGFTFAKFALQDGVFEVENNKKMFSVNLVSSKPKQNYDFKKKEFSITLQLITTRSEGREEGKTISFEMSKEEQQKLNQAIYESIKGVVDFGKEINVDILKISDGFYKLNPKYEREIKSKEFLDKINLKVKVNLTQR